MKKNWRFVYQDNQFYGECLPCTLATFMTIIDSGDEYNPLLKEDPDVTLSAEERQIGGLGIFIVKKSMDKVDYIRSGGRNHLILTKSFDNKKK